MRAHLSIKGTALEYDVSHKSRCYLSSMSRPFLGRHFGCHLLGTIVLHNPSVPCISSPWLSVESIHIVLRSSVPFTFDTRTWSKHLILSPGAMITVVKTPAKPPAANNCARLRAEKVSSVTPSTSSSLTYNPRFYQMVFEVSFRCQIQESRSQTSE